MMMNRCFLCLAILTLYFIDYGIQASRIRRLVGGIDAFEYEFPYQVSLRYYRLHICSGVLISDKHVLSAAHCICGLIDEPTEELYVRTGSVNFKNEGEIHNVKSIVCHPDYVYGAEDSWINDLVVITLTERICITPCQSPIALANCNVPVGKRVVISGWGRGSVNSYLSKNLQKLFVPVIDNEICQKYYKNVTILASQMCTLERKGIGACMGDSGSPLVYNGMVAGIFSWTKPCAIGYPDVFVRVSHFTNFIQQAMQDN